MSRLLKEASFLGRQTASAIGYADLLGRLPKGVGPDASWGARHPAFVWMPLQKLDKIERAERNDRLVVLRPKRRGMAVWKDGKKNKNKRISP